LGRASVDAVAAAVILKEYLERREGPAVASDAPVPETNPPDVAE
jgi:hypothetical protein